MAEGFLRGRGDSVLGLAVVDGAVGHSGHGAALPERHLVGHAAGRGRRAVSRRSADHREYCPGSVLRDPHHLDAGAVVPARGAPAQSQPVLKSC